MRHNKSIKSNSVVFVTTEDITAMADFLKAFQLKNAVRKLKIKKKK